MLLEGGERGLRGDGSGWPGQGAACWLECGRATGHRPRVLTMQHAHMQARRGQRVLLATHPHQPPPLQSNTHRKQVPPVLGLVLVVVHHVRGHHDLLAHHVREREHGAAGVALKQGVHDPEAAHVVVCACMSVGECVVFVVGILCASCRYPFFWPFFAAEGESLITEGRAAPASSKAEWIRARPLSLPVPCAPASLLSPSTHPSCICCVQQVHVPTHPAPCNTANPTHSHRHPHSPYSPRALQHRQPHALTPPPPLTPPTP